ncbi:MAG: hypothetical protein LBD75_02410 [Candidatus Peribacteria bacterium]|jgi:DNA repair exonuclease SbcCD ATPase subunit|nr:hypothetical protein [Candidatus Peribacteria bacterium]
MRDGLIIALMAVNLAACSPDVDKMAEKIIDLTEEVNNDLKAMKELSTQYEDLQEIVNKGKAVAQTGKKMYNNNSNNKKELRRMEKKLIKGIKEINEDLEDLKMLRVDFSRVGGDLNILGTYPSFDTTLQ